MSSSSTSTSANGYATNRTTLQYRNHSSPKIDGHIPQDNKDKKPTTTVTTTSIVKATLAQPLLTTTLPLLFIGCCTNVYALESLLQLTPQTGTLITCLQFALISLYKLPSQLTFHTDSSLPTLRPRSVPLKQWTIFAVQFVAINVLNNAAFGYKISLPLHIILRSGGPVMGMLVGWGWRGRGYARSKVIGVICLFCGVVLAALSDAGGKSDHSHSSSSSTAGEDTSGYTFAQQAPGFLLLTAALFLSAVMGVWSDGLYDTYGRSHAIADEQLFYGHFLSLPYFALQQRTLVQQYRSLSAAAAAASSFSSTSNSLSTLPILTTILQFLPARAMKSITQTVTYISRPLLLLLVNAMTQIACITGVHTLSTQTTALTVSIVLNVRKLVSLVLSIWVFGNVLPMGVVGGGALVGVGVGLYSLPTGKYNTAKANGVVNGKQKKGE